MEHHSASSATDPIPCPTASSARWQIRLPLLCVGLLLAVFLTGAAASADASPDLLDVAKIVSVVSFVGSMVALCMGMIGDAYRA